ncbi:hypothetical protein ACQU0X_27305 [Pseudovibrio ascidiaceicola]|uniref:hypothetical protein n=1 Tax=Pseudovibrio ascidiaceicola TaxID=285279 RepID=UPI003D35C7A7
MRENTNLNEVNKISQDQPPKSTALPEHTGKEHSIGEDDHFGDIIIELGQDLLTYPISLKVASILKQGFLYTKTPQPEVLVFNTIHHKTVLVNLFQAALLHFKEAKERLPTLSPALWRCVFEAIKKPYIKDPDSRLSQLSSEELVLFFVTDALNLTDEGTRQKAEAEALNGMVFFSDGYDNNIPPTPNNDKELERLMLSQNEWADGGYFAINQSEGYDLTLVNTEKVFVIESAAMFFQRAKKDTEFFKQKVSLKRQEVFELFGRNLKGEVSKKKKDAGVLSKEVLQQLLHLTPPPENDA